MNKIMTSSKALKTQLFEQLARVGKALSNANRLQLLELVAQGERSVDVLADLTGMSKANTSKHLQELRATGLVTGRREGLFVHYSLAGDDVVTLYAALHGVAENRIAEVDRILRLWLSKRDSLEAVPAEEVLDRLKRGIVTVLDVRPQEEYAAGHLPGAINVPVDRLEDYLAKLPKRKEVIAYCRGPYCVMSFDAVEKLRNMGWKARRLEAGFPEWRAAGHPVESSR